MSEIITAYPTASLETRTPFTVMNAMYNYLVSITALTDYFDITMNGTEEDPVGNINIKLTKGGAYAVIKFSSNSGYPIGIYLGENNGSYTGSWTSGSLTSDLPVRYAVGKDGTGALWFDNYSKRVCLVFNKSGNTYLMLNATVRDDYFAACDSGGSTYQSDTVNNGSNIGKGIDYIAQPYFHRGINTGDIYTFDGGGAAIPWGEFKLGDAEFVRLCGNFALRLK